MFKCSTIMTRFGGYANVINNTKAAYFIQHRNVT